MNWTTPLGWTALAGALALLATVSTSRAARRAHGRERLSWSLLAAASSLVLAAKISLELAARSGEGWLAAPVARLAGNTVLSCLVLFALYFTAVFRPHSARPRAVRPARVVDTLLVGLLFLGLQGYFLTAWQVGGFHSSRRAPAAGLALLMGPLAALALRSCARRTHSPGGQRTCRLLGYTALCEAAGQAMRIWDFDPPLVLTSTAAEVLQACAFAVLSRAALGSPESAPLEEPPAELAVVSAWRELSVPALVLLGLLGIPLLEGAASRAAGFGAPELALHWGLLSIAVGLHVLLVLLRQFLVQMENRALAWDLGQESARLQLLVDNIHDAVVTEELDGRILFANDRFLELFKVRRQDLHRLRLDDCIHPEDRPLSPQNRTGRLLAAAGPARFEFRGLRRDGALLYLDSSTVPVEASGLVRGFQSVIRDISARRQAEEQQRDLVQRLEFFVNHMPLGCIVWDLDYRIVEWNNSAARIFGWEAAEVFGRHGLELLAPEAQWPAMMAAWQELQESKTSNHAAFRNLTKQRGPIECEWFNTSLIDHSGRVVAVASMVQDVTEKKSLEEQLRQSQKMEAVGVLAGGVAHDFNNLLTIISGNLSLAQSQLGAAHPAARGLADAEKAADRAADLVRQLLGFGRKSLAQPRPLRLNDCLGDLSLLRRTIDPRIVIETRLQPDLWGVEADPGQISQILMNLAVNARDAMPDGGRLTISTTNRTLDPAWCHARPQTRPGQFVELSVADTGAGMDEATRARIFEPFFTTKAVGKGTGLGLAMVYGIVKQHGGWITVESEPGKGSVFSIFLPRSESAGAAPVTAPAAAAAGGSETILLVDDEEGILRLARAILEGVGHRVIEARDGEQALEVFGKRRTEIDLVLLDMIMPRKSGRDTLAELHLLAPEVPVVLASGYTPVSAEELAALGARAYVQKPYQPAELARAVRQVLDSAARPGPARSSRVA